jgi:hypothetical protein
MKPGWTIDLKPFASFKKEVKGILGQEPKNAATRALEIAVEEAPIKTGALKASGYLVWRDSNGRLHSRYSDAIAEARRLNPIAVARGQIENELSPPKSGLFYDQEGWAAFDFPLQYAGIIRDGFPHVLAGRDIPANDFIQRALDQTEAPFRETCAKRLQVAMRNLENKR